MSRQKNPDKERKKERISKTHLDLNHVKYIEEFSF